MTVTNSPHRARARRLDRRVPVLAVLALVLLAGCGTTRFEAESVIPQPLVTRIPVVVGVHVPPAFREAVHSEKRDGFEYVL